MNRIYSILTFLLIGICSAQTYAAPTEDTDSVAPSLLQGDEATKALKQITEKYSDWSTAEISGKITSLQLFIKPSLKIFMKRGEEMLISVRVPFKGEVARMELDRDTVLVVNKLNATFVKEPLEKLTQMADITISDVQDIILGRAFIAGRGTLSAKDKKRVDIYSLLEGFIVMPAPSVIDPLLTYGFYTQSDGHVDRLVVNSQVDNTLAELEYTYNNNSTDLDFTIIQNGKSNELTFELDNPRFDVKGFERFDIPTGYQKETPHEFIKRIMK